MAARIALLGVDEVGEFGRVANEENGGIVKDPVPVALGGAQLDGEATGIACGIGTAGLATNSGEADRGAMLCAHVGQHGGGRNISERVGQLEVTVSTSALGVDLGQGR